MNIRSKRLVVTMDPPNHGWASTNRFDRTGSVISIVLDGQHHFTTPEVLHSEQFTTGGMGLMAEFVCPAFSDAAKPGERYHKVGVGMVSRGEQEVTIASACAYDCVPYDTSYEVIGEDTVVFRSIAPLLHGWAFTIERKVQVVENRLIMQATLVNQGEKHMDLMEYNHNFVNLDDRPVNSQYKLDLSYDLQLDVAPRGGIVQHGKTFAFPDQIDGAFFLTTDTMGDAPAYAWTLSHGKDQLSIQEEVSEKPCRTAIWGTPHVISAEVFVPISLAPLESKTWTRTWTFHK